jgi:hypothetical protein
MIDNHSSTSRPPFTGTYANEWTEDAYEDIWAGAVALQGLAPGMFEVDAALMMTC